MSIIKRLQEKQEKNYTTFTWKGEPMRLYRLTPEKMQRVWEEAEALTSEEILRIDPELKKQARDEKAWETLKRGFVSMAFAEPKNQWELKRILAIVARWGRLCNLEQVRDDQGNSPFEPSEEDCIEREPGYKKLSASKQQEVQATLFKENREWFESQIEESAELQSLLLAANHELTPQYIRDYLDGKPEKKSRVERRAAGRPSKSKKSSARRS